MPKTLRRHVIVLVALIVSSLLGTTSAGAQSVEERQLAEARRRIAAVQSELSNAEASRATDAEALARAEEQLLEVLEAVGEAEQAVQRQRTAVDDATARLAALEAEAIIRAEDLATRAVELYKQSTESESFAAVLSSDTPQEALERSNYAQVVSREDRRGLEEATATGVAVDAQRDVLAQEQATLERVLAQQEELQAEAEQVREERSLVLAESSERVQRLQVQEQHLEAEEAELEELARAAEERAAAAAAALAEEVAQAEQAAQAAASARASSSGGGSAAAAEPAQAAAAPTGSSGSSDSSDSPSASGSSTGSSASSGAAASGGGGWRWPAAGVVTSGFGQRGGRLHAGIDIGAPTGTPVYAARGGTVSDAGWSGNYGNRIVVSHGGGVTSVYAHLSRIDVGAGASVGAGSVIGQVGSTGRSTGPHLHFEVRVDGAPTNPRAYLP